MDGVTVLTLETNRDGPEGAALDARHRAVLQAVEGTPGVVGAAIHSWFGSA